MIYLSSNLKAIPTDKDENVNDQHIYTHHTSVSSFYSDSHDLSNYSLIGVSKCVGPSNQKELLVFWCLCYMLEVGFYISVLDRDI